MKILKNLNEDKYILVILLILALTIRYIVFIETGDQNADGMYRRILTMNWLKNPYFITEGIWPPLHFYLMASMLWIFKDPFTSTRLVSLVSGILIIFPYYYLVKSLFSKKAAIISTLILIFLSMHIQFSTLSMSEVPLLLFLFTSLYFLYKFKTTEQSKSFYLIISSIFLNFASMTRYEAWFFIPILSLYTISGPNEVKKLASLESETSKYFFMFLIISLITPLFWMAGNYYSHGDPFYPQNYSDNWIRKDAILNPDSYLNEPFIKKLVMWPGVLSSILWPLSIGFFKRLNIILLFSLIGILISLFRKKNLEFLTIFIILIIIFTYKLFNSTMLPQPRHMLLPVVFLIPYFTTGLDYILKNLDKRKNNMIVIIIIMFFISASSYSAVMNNPYVTPEYVLDVSDWLKNNVKPGEKILIDEYNWWGLHILFYSGFNTTFTEGYDSNFEFVTDQVRIIRGGGKRIDESTVIGYLKDFNPSYLVYSPGGQLARILNFSAECQDETRFNRSFECKYTTANYNVYELKQGS